MQTTAITRRSVHPEAPNIVHAQGVYCCLEIDHLPPDRDIVRIAREMSDGARRVLVELVELCPREVDTTGVSKFGRSDEKTARRYLGGELVSLGMVGRRIGALGMYPTALARAVAAKLRGES